MPSELATEAYVLALGKLIERVAAVHESERAKEWDITAHRTAIEEIARTLQRAADLLAGKGVTQTAIEAFHDERGALPPAAGMDGWPIAPPPHEPQWSSYKSITADIHTLAESASLAARELPNSRKRHALPFAARGFLHLRQDYGFPRPSLYKDGPDVLDLADLCGQAGMVLSLETYAGALRESLRTFDPHYTEPEFLFLYR